MEVTKNKTKKGAVRAWPGVKIWRRVICVKTPIHVRIDVQRGWDALLKLPIFEAAATGNFAQTV